MLSEHVPFQRLKRIQSQLRITGAATMPRTFASRHRPVLRERDAVQASGVVVRLRFNSPEMVLTALEPARDLAQPN